METTPIITPTEENYLKAIHKHMPVEGSVSTNTLAAELSTTPASVTDMIKKLFEKGLIFYTPYRGVSLTPVGETEALRVIRRHRLWESFLVDKLQFGWEEVHETAELLEHIRSPKLIQKLEEFLGNPKFDPHGDPIPDDKGKMPPRKTKALAEVGEGKTATIAAVNRHQTDFLQYLSRIGLTIGATVKVREHIKFDDSRTVEVGGKEVIVSSAVTQNVLVHD